MGAPLRYLSGIQPSGHQHLGNYFGAIRKHVANQDNAFYFIADYHAMNSTQDAAVLKENVTSLAATYLAFGLDPERATLWRQSDVPEVTELAWMLGTVTTMGLLERAVSYKEKVERGQEAKVGLFTYPVLQAADILAFDADVVPVGKDQSQHLEMTRDMAGYFNRAFSPVFKSPKTAYGTPELVPGLDGAKMSKSYDNHIPIFLKGKALKKRVMAITTDSTPLEDPKDPDTCTVFALYSLMGTEEENAALAAKYRGGNFGYGHAKLALLEKINEYFGPARERYDALMANPEEIEAALQIGARRARTVAQGVLARAREAVGMNPRPAQLG
ncbi:MAG: tryptophan--tRNA ligase [Bradymonadia bacterium]